MTSKPLVSRTFATLRSAEFGFLGVVVYTRVQTPRFCGEPASAGTLLLAGRRIRALRTNWLIVGIISDPEKTGTARLRETAAPRNTKTADFSWEIDPSSTSYDDFSPGPTRRGRRPALALSRQPIPGRIECSLGPIPQAIFTMPSALFQPVRLRGLALENRIMVSPMCQYSAVDGCMTDWHLAHLGMLANSGAALLCFEMTDVEAIGRITPGCSGLYSDANEAALTRVVAHCRAHGQAKLALQLAHAGRKASTTPPWDPKRTLTPAEGGWE